MTLVINFSGGKDSAAMLAYICERWPSTPKHVVFADTGWEHSDAEDWSRKLVSKFGLPLNVVRNPNKDFFSMVRQRKMFPSPKHRQCTSDLKRGPIQTWIRQNVTDKLVVNCMGLRAEESPNRAKKLRLARDQSLSNSRRTVWNWLPIHQWTKERVLGYLASKSIPLHPVYNYLSRFSCQMCIYHSQADLAAVKANNPQAYELMSNLEREIGFSLKPDFFLDELING